MLVHYISSEASIVNLDYIRPIIFLGHQSSLRLQLADLLAFDIFRIVSLFIDHNSHLEVNSLFVSDVVLMSLQDLFECGIRIFVFYIDRIGIDLDHEVIEGPIFLKSVVL
jgi:hypothetical protein